LDKTQRKAAAAAYKERKPAWGVFAVVCGATGETWVGRSLNVDTHQNRLWAELRQGKSPHRSLQAAWTEHAEPAFRYEELERLREDFPEFACNDELKKRQALWKARLQASDL
jgi:hypothetical protein